MTERTYQVGDVVVWGKVPSGALIRDTVGDFAVRHGGERKSNGSWVKVEGEAWIAFQGAWRWWVHDGSDPVTIIALDVPADATADDLRTLAEVYEVREALYAMTRGDHAAESTLERFIKSAATGPTFGDLLRAFDATAKLLYAAGWRPGMTAEDAAWLLAEQEATCRQ